MHVFLELDLKKYFAANMPCFFRITAKRHCAYRVHELALWHLLSSEEVGKERRQVRIKFKHQPKTKKTNSRAKSSVPPLPSTRIPFNESKQRTFTVTRDSLKLMLEQSCKCKEEKPMRLSGFLLLKSIPKPVWASAACLMAVGGPPGSAMAAMTSRCSILTHQLIPTV